MQDIHLKSIDRVVDRILPITELRRNPTEAFRKLDRVGGFIITKDGKPVGKLLPLEKKKEYASKKSNLKRLKSLSGGFKIGINLTPKQINALINQSYG